MRRERPINAELPVMGGNGQTPDEQVKPRPAAPRRKTPPARRRRRTVPAALKLIAATVAVAIAFLIAAVLGGRGSSEEEKPGATPAPLVVADNDGEGDEASSAATAAQLGYPAFATNNTVRVGGSDPASNAAAVALAVYPSTDPAQRPDAVTLVDGESWQEAVAASVLMAAPLRAPILISGTADLPDATSQALAALAPEGSSQTHGAQAFVIGGAEAPDGVEATAVGSRSPAKTAAEIAALRDRLFGDPPAHLVIAPLGRADFAVPAAAWAARSGDPILFATEEKLPAPTAAMLARHAKLPVYVLGPSSAISSKVVRKIDKVGGEVSRVSGEDPVTNAIAFARYADGDFGWNINDPGHGFVVARSDAALDAAISSPLSASGTWGPLLLTDSADTLPLALRDYLLDIKPGYATDPTRAFYNHVWVIGDEEAIDVNQQAEIDRLAEVERTRGEP